MGALMLCYHSVHLVLRLEVETMQKCLKLNTVSESTSASQSLHTFTLSRWRTSVSSYSSCQAPRELPLAKKAFGMITNSTITGIVL